MTLDFVYSWPDFATVSVGVKGSPRIIKETYVYFGVVRERSKALVQSLVHLLGIALEEAATAWGTTH